jgi:formate-dependent phosphoribosylglycinamide formyltransferase (GAR transformylase)
VNRRDLIERVSERIGRRQLVYVGTRGDDAEAIGDVPQLGAVFSLVASLQARSSIRSLALEDLSGERVDLDTSDIDEQFDDPAVFHFRRAIMQALTGDTVVVTYRPTAFLSGICFSAGGRCEYAGMFHAQQQAFEHKPWVETSVRRLGVDTIPWIYVSDEHELEVLGILAGGPVVLRRSRSSGGTGIVRVERATALEVPWAIDADGFLSAAPYIEGTPANVSGVVWHDGVTVHCPSVQIVGVDLLTTREFGYCGNDFDAACDLEPTAIDEMESMTVRVGEWLRTSGFLGAFGVDFIVNGSQVRFVELNPRLQGVTHLACQWAAATERSCVLLEHLAASLGLGAPPSEPLAVQLREMAGLSHIVLHESAATPSAPAEEVARRLAAQPEVRRVDVLPRPGVRLAEGAPLARATLGVRATDDGFSLTPDIEGLVRRVIHP